MSYKSDLQQNNADLQSILDGVNALPDAGSGGGGASVETCTVNCLMGNYTFYGTVYRDGKITAVVQTVVHASVSDVLCNSCILVCSPSQALSTVEGAEQMYSWYFNNSYLYVYRVTASAGGQVTIQP